MTIEDIERILGRVAENQARHDQAQARFDETVKQIAESHKTLVELVRIQEERIDGHDSARHESDERLEALINAQVRYEARHDRLEEAFRQVAASQAQLVEMLQLHEERLDGQDEASVHTESRLDALIDSQIRLTERVDTLTRDIAAVNGRAAATDERLDRIAEHLESHEKQLGQILTAIDTLTQTQARTDEQIRALAERNGGSAK